MEYRTLDPALARWTKDQITKLGCTPDFQCEPLLVEASHRLFYRIHARRARGEITFVVMNSPPEKENNAQFVTMAKVFARNGVGVPQLFAEDAASGFFLLSDLGPRHFADVYASSVQDQALRAGIDTLVQIQRIDDAAVPDYGANRFRDELAIFRDWFVIGWAGERFPHADLDGVFERLVANTQEQIQCCVHRDFHSRNLLLAADGRVGVVDFQDALIGPVSYDLASLLRDCYFRFAEGKIERWREYYLNHTPFALDSTEFAVNLDLTAVQRHLKAVGIFARLELRDGKSSHIKHIPPVLAHLHDLAERYEDLAPLRAHLARWRLQTDSRLRSGP